MGKKFEEPIITDCFDAVEGVFAASGFVPDTPPKPNGDNWTWVTTFEHHDTGTLSSVHVRGRSKRAGSGASVTVSLLDGTRTIKEVKNFSLPLGFTYRLCGNTIYFTTSSSYNPNEGVDISFECVFGGAKDGAYGEGGHTLSEAEKNTTGVIDTSWQ